MPSQRFQTNTIADIPEFDCAIANGVLGKFDPSLLQNDSYILRLEVADNGGNISYACSLI
jgi:hypothetical protein